MPTLTMMMVMMTLGIIYLSVGYKVSELLHTLLSSHHCALLLFSQTFADHVTRLYLVYMLDPFMWNTIF